MGFNYPVVNLSKDGTRKKRWYPQDKAAGNKR